MPSGQEEHLISFQLLLLTFHCDFWELWDLAAPRSLHLRGCGQAQLHLGTGAGCVVLTISVEPSPPRPLAANGRVTPRLKGRSTAAMKILGEMKCLGG